MPAPSVKQRLIADFASGEILTPPRMTELARGNNEALRYLSNLMPPGEAVARNLLVTVKITSNVGIGVYNAKTFEGPIIPTATDLGEESFGIIAADEDVIVWEPASVALGTALPLNGLVTVGWIIGGDSSDPPKPIVEIPPPGVRNMRYKVSTKMLQVAYVDNPAVDGDWVDKIQFVACP